MTDGGLWFSWKSTIHYTLHYLTAYGQQDTSVVPRVPPLISSTFWLQSKNDWYFIIFKPVIMLTRWASLQFTTVFIYTPGDGFLRPIPDGPQLSPLQQVEVIVKIQFLGIQHCRKPMMKAPPQALEMASNYAWLPMPFQNAEHQLLIARPLVPATLKHQCKRQDPQQCHLLLSGGF